MATSPKEALPTQQFINLRGVKNGILILKDGGLRQILLVAGLNFDLKSEDEQNAITMSYQGFLNSLNFSLQIFIHSRRVNIEGYLSNLKKREAEETNPLLKTQIAEYGEFVRSFTSENAIMNKAFFVVVPFDPVQLPNTDSGGLLGRLLGKAKPAAGVETDEDRRFNQNAGQLAQRTEQVITGLGQIGLKAIAMNDEEVIELLYNLYNPESIERKGMDLEHGGAAGNSTRI